MNHSRVGLSVAVALCALGLALPRAQASNYTGKVPERVNHFETPGFEILVTSDIDFLLHAPVTLR